MRVLATADTTGSGWYRIRQPIEQLVAEGLEASIAEKGLPIALKGKEVKGVDVGGCDVLVLERPMAWFMPDVIRMVRRRGTAVVVEVDDDFHAVHPTNRAFDFANPSTSPGSNWNLLMKCCREADLVTVSTPALAKRYGAHGRVAVLRNCANDDWFEIGERATKITGGAVVGWGGTARNHPNDLQVTHGGVAAAVNDAQGKFINIGGDDSQKEVVKRALGEMPIEFTAWMPLDELYPHVLAKLDVGIAPLADTKFNEAKSWLKGLEYATLGVPFVASNVAEYRALYGCGAGTLAEPRARDWHRSILRLLRDERERAEMIEMGRIAAKRKSASQNAWRWQEAWAQAMTNHKKRSGQCTVR